jgi:hypothetical protein
VEVEPGPGVRPGQIPTGPGLVAAPGGDGLGVRESHGRQLSPAVPTQTTTLLRPGRQSAPQEPFPLPRRPGFPSPEGMPLPPPKRENLFINIACNIVVPTVVLTKFSTENRLGPMWGMVVALAFPLGYGIYDLVRRKKTNVFSIVGICSVLLTGGFNYLKMDALWFAVKEAAVPLVFGAAVLISNHTRYPLVREVLCNDQIMDMGKIEAALAERGTRAAFDRLLVNASFAIAGSFVLSALLNFGLARYLLRSPAGTPEFNAELGRMNVLNWPVIVLPSMVVTLFIFWKLMSGITRLTGLDLEGVLRTPEPKQAK